MSRLRLGAPFVALLFLTIAAHAADVPWPHNDLERLLVAGSNDPAQRLAFMQAILGSKLCALTDQKVPEDLTHAAPGAGFKILGVQAPDGQQATPVFTAPERVTAIFPDKFPICLQGAILLSKIRGQRVVLNPGQPYGVVWSPDELDHLLGVERTRSIANVQFTTPDRPPAALVARLKETLGSIAGIRAAWLALAYWPDQKEWAWFLEVHTDSGHQQLEAVIDAATQGIDMQGRPLDISFLPPDAPPGKGIALLDR